MQYVIRESRVIEYALMITTQPTSVNVEKIAGISAKRIWQLYLHS